MLNKLIIDKILYDNFVAGGKEGEGRRTNAVALRPKDSLNKQGITRETENEKENILYHFLFFFHFVKGRAHSFWNHLSYAQRQYGNTVLLCHEERWKRKKEK